MKKQDGILINAYPETGIFSGKASQSIDFQPPKYALGGRREYVPIALAAGILVSSQELAQGFASLVKIVPCDLVPRLEY